jgi:hypothetical protein
MGIHVEFWEWVLSHEAADGYWMHSHGKLYLHDTPHVISLFSLSCRHTAGGKILCFDLTTFEDFVGNGEFPSTLLYGGRFRQLSSLHDFGNLEKTNISQESRKRDATL